MIRGFAGRSPLPPLLDVESDLTGRQTSACAKIGVTARRDGTGSAH
jgi:hypothetical protein